MTEASERPKVARSPANPAKSQPDRAASRHKSVRPTRAEAEAAVRVLLAWSGDDIEREGLRDTPRRVVEAFEEYFQGYGQNPAEILSTTFADVAGYDDLVLLRGIRVVSHCEHHIAPFVGQAHVACLPAERVVGLSKIARLVEMYAHRLQTQEALTAQIADAMKTHLAPRGVAVLIEAEHQCMSLRGVSQPGVATITTRFAGMFETDQNLRDRFLSLIHR